MYKDNVIAIDIAKSVFQVCVFDKHNQIKEIVEKFEEVSNSVWVLRKRRGGRSSACNSWGG